MKLGPAGLVPTHLSSSASSSTSSLPSSHSSVLPSSDGSSIPSSSLLSPATTLPSAFQRSSSLPAQCPTSHASLPWHTLVVGDTERLGRVKKMRARFENYSAVDIGNVRTMKHSFEGQTADAGDPFPWQNVKSYAKRPTCSSNELTWFPPEKAPGRINRGCHQLLLSDVPRPFRCSSPPFLHPSCAVIPPNITDEEKAELLQEKQSGSYMDGKPALRPKPLLTRSSKKVFIEEVASPQKRDPCATPRKSSFVFDGPQSHGVCMRQKGATSYISKTSESMTCNGEATKIICLEGENRSGHVDSMRQLSLLEDISVTSDIALDNASELITVDGNLTKSSDPSVPQEHSMTTKAEHGNCDALISTSKETTSTQKGVHQGCTNESGIPMPKTSWIFNPIPKPPRSFAKKANIHLAEKTISEKYDLYALPMSEVQQKAELKGDCNSTADSTAEQKVLSINVSSCMKTDQEPFLKQRQEQENEQTSKLLSPSRRAGARRSKVCSVILPDRSQLPPPPPPPGLKPNFYSENLNTADKMHASEDVLNCSGEKAVSSGVNPRRDGTRYKTLTVCSSVNQEEERTKASLQQKRDRRWSHHLDIWLSFGDVFRRMRDAGSCEEKPSGGSSTSKADTASSSSTMSESSSPIFGQKTSTEMGERNEDPPKPMENIKPRKRSHFLLSEPLYQQYRRIAHSREIRHQRRAPSFKRELLRTGSKQHSSPGGDSPAPQERKSHSSVMGASTLWQGLPKVLASGLLERLSADEIKRQEAMFELVTSEASYLRSMNVMFELFVQSQDLAALLSAHDRRILFSNLPDVREASERFLEDLEDRVEENPQISDVSDIVLQHSQQGFKCYISYVTNQPYQEQAYQQLCQENPQFLQIMSRLQDDPRCERLPFMSFLILPFQRITRLKLLVENILKRTEMDSAAEETASKALNAMKKIVHDCNEGVRKMKQMEELICVGKQIEFHKTKAIGIISQSRWLLKRGEMFEIIVEKGILSNSKGKTSLKPLHLLLFNDLLLITKKSTGRLQVLDYGHRAMAQATDVFCQPNDNNFLLVFLENHQQRHVEHLLQATTPSDKQRWIEAISPSKKAEDGEQIYEDWDCPQVQCIHTYTAQQADELSLEEADVINVTRKTLDGWMQGMRLSDGEQGWFPKSYVEEITNHHVRARNLRERFRVMCVAQRLQSQCFDS
uniref:rho guanine nucleotide exchange factor 19-like isoform X2 n=1 Tax=Myxine glutinosa TaxID=7769 RepID=UPI00358F3455